MPNDYRVVAPLHGSALRAGEEERVRPESGGYCPCQTEADGSSNEGQSINYRSGVSHAQVPQGMRKKPWLGVARVLCLGLRRFGRLEPINQVLKIRVVGVVQGGDERIYRELRIHLLYLSVVSARGGLIAQPAIGRSDKGMLAGIHLRQMHEGLDCFGDIRGL